MYLLDTHAIIWFLEGNSSLSQAAKSLLVNDSEKIIVSSVSFWEMAIKISINKLDLEKPLSTVIKNVENLWSVDYKLTPDDFYLIENMPFVKFNGIEHRDPFDRMLIAQALTRKIHIISCDEKFDLYPTITRIW